MPALEALGARLRAASDVDAFDPSAAAAASVAAAAHFARDVALALAEATDEAEARAQALTTGGRDDATTEDASFAESAADAAAHDAALLAVSRATWSLAVTYFVEPGDGTGFVADRLADWYREHASSLGFGPDSLPERLARLLAAIQDPDAPELRVRPERAEGYWPCFASLVALGWTDAATDLLGMHGCWAEWRVGKPDAKPLAELLEAVVALLRTQPGMTGAKAFESGSSRDARKEATSAPQLAAFREAWLRQVRAVLDDAALFDAVSDAASAEGARHALAAMAGEQSAVLRAAKSGGWLELAVADARCRFPDARAGTHGSLVRRALAAAGPGPSPEMDALLASVMEMDAARFVAACAAHTEAWFQAHVAELLVAAAGEGHACATREPDPDAGARVFSHGGDDLSSSGATLRRPTRAMRGGTQAEMYAVEYALALATRRRTRALAARALARCPTRGAGVAAAAVRASAPAPGAYAEDAEEFLEGDNKADVSDDMETGTEEDARGNDDGAQARVRDRRAARLAAEYDASRRAFETCAAFGLSRAGLGVARCAAAAARQRGDAQGAAAWAHRAGDRAGVAASALAQLPNAREAAGNPGACGEALARLARQHPHAAEASRGAHEALAGAAGRGSGAVAAEMRARYAGPEGFLDALAALRATTNALAETGAGEETREARARRVAAPATKALARRGGAILAHALAAHGDGREHLWPETMFQAIALLEGAHVAVDPAQAQTCVARLEELEAAKARTRGDLDRGDAGGGMRTEADLRVAAARHALARAHARASAVGVGGRK